MSDPRTPDLERVILTGLLETGAPLHIGSGFDDPAPADDPDTDRSAIIAVCRDATARPYLPASTLRGLLRRHAPPDGACAARLFGYARQAVPKGSPTATADIGRAGALRVYDARVAGDAPVTLATDTRIAIDPITRTARDRHLFTEQWVPQQTRFHCRFELDRIDQADLDAFLTMLQAAFDGGPDNGLGAGRSRMHGRLHWTKDGLRLRTLSRDDYLLWLWANAPLDRFYQERNVAIVTSPPDPAPLTLSVRIYPRSPLLVSRVPTKQETLAQKHPPHRIVMTAEGQVRIPASSLKGALRAQARRILMTIVQHRNPKAPPDHCRGVADALIGKVFGSTAAIAGLFVGEARGDYDPPRDLHPQWFNALDRFTGGAAEQRLYNVVAAIPDRLDFDLSLQPRLRGEPWVLGLLCYLLRDALEGDIALGWGRARGYGAVRMILAEADTAGLPDTAARPAGLDRPLPAWKFIRPLVANALAGSIEPPLQDWLNALDTIIDDALISPTGAPAPADTGSNEGSTA